MAASRESELSIAPKDSHEQIREGVRITSGSLTEEEMKQWKENNSNAQNAGEGVKAS